MLPFKDFDRFATLVERKGNSADNSLAAVANRLDDTGLVDIGALPCWCVTVVPPNVQHTSWCLKLRAGFKEFSDFVRSHRQLASQNPVVSDANDHRLGRGEL